MSRSCSVSSDPWARGSALPLIPAQGHGRRLFNRLPQILAQVEEVIRAAVESGRHTNGPLVAEVERRCEHVLGVAEAVAMNSGSSALRAACELLRLPPDSEIIVPGFTFAMTAYAISDAFAVAHGTETISKRGLVAVFVDVDPQTYTLSPQAVWNALSARTKAIMVVHLFGQMAEMRPLLDLASRTGLLVMEDAAQAMGATSTDPLTGASWHAGAVGHFGCFSLSDVKNIGSMGADAGLLTITRRLLDLECSASVADRARAWRNTGRMSAHRYCHQVWGMRARMDEYSAAECLAELDLLDGWLEHRRAIAARYSEALGGSAFTPPFVAPGRQHTYFAYMVKAPDVVARAEFVRRLKEARIEVGDSYTVVADQDLYRTGKLPCRLEPLEVSRALADLLVPIPCYPELTAEEIERIETVLQGCRSI